MLRPFCFEVFFFQGFSRASPSSWESIGLKRISKGWSVLIRFTVEGSLEPVQ